MWKYCWAEKIVGNFICFNQPKKEKIKAEFQAEEKVMAKDFTTQEEQMAGKVVNHRIGSFL